MSISISSIMQYKHIGPSMLIFIALARVAGFPLAAQVGVGGQPASFGSEELRSASSPITPAIRQVAPDVNPDDFLETADRQARNGGPIRVGKRVAADLDLRRDGACLTLENGIRIRRLRINVSDCSGFALFYEKFNIPAGGHLFIYTPDRKQLLGAYTRETNPTGGIFATEIVNGGSAILEYEYPIFASVQEEPQICIDGIGLIFRNWGESGSRLRGTGENSSQSCEVDVNCSEGDRWQAEKNGIVHIMCVSDEGIAFCSGTLVNNTKKDFKPYILTAGHCSERWDGSGNLTHDKPEDFLRYIFYFHYEKPGCKSNEIAKRKSVTMVGARLCTWLSPAGESDGELLELTQAIPKNYNVYYNGWSRSLLAPESGVCLHHPNGDAMKISTYTEAAATRTWQGAMAGAHWNVTFAATPNGHGITEGGSSGSGLFDSEHRIRATLTGGNASCSYLIGTSMYGKLAYHWNKFKGDGCDSTKSMDRYLDPGASDPEKIDGSYQGVLLPSVAVVSADYNGKEVKIVWNRPLHASPIGYLLSRNNAELTRLASTDTSYIDTPTEKGYYTYSVTAVYDGEQRALPRKGHVLVNDFAPPANVGIYPGSDNKTRIYWSSPVNSQIITQSRQREQSKSYLLPAMPQLTELSVAQGWSPGELTVVRGNCLTEVRLRVLTDSATYTVFACQGARRYEETVIVPAGYNHKEVLPVKLQTPFVINDTNILYIGYRVKSKDSPGEHRTGLRFRCIALDAGPAYDGGGNYYSTDGISFSTGSIEKNFILEARINSTLGQLPNTDRASAKNNTSDVIKDFAGRFPVIFPKVTGYEIYRDNVLIADLPASKFEYTDEQSPEGKHVYHVTAKYTYGKSTTENVRVSLSGDSFSQAWWNPRELSVNFGGVKDLLSARLLDLSGRTIRTYTRRQTDHLHTGSLPTGVYILKLSTIGREQTLKIVIP